MEKIYHNQKGQQVGWLKDGIFRKQVDSRRHKMKIFECYGIDSKIIQDLAKNNCTEVKIKETDTGHIYASPFSLWQSEGFEKDFGDGKQTFLSMKHYNNDKQNKLI